jgi:predicted GTPase
LAGERYPSGIPIYPEVDLVDLIQKHQVDQVIFAYSDVSHEYVMHKASQVLCAGSDFRLMGPRSTQIKSIKPVVSICAARTGSGKSQTSRRVVVGLRQLGYKVAVVRHPMPYGDLIRQAVQRFASIEDLEVHQCTIEEREEYEPHLALGSIVYAGIDYERILKSAEAEADIILWDGGNNDLPFIHSDFHIVVVDPHRPGHELKYYPGETNVLAADVIVINKVDTASPEDIIAVRKNLYFLNPDAIIIEAASPIFVGESHAIRGKRVIVVEDGPTLTHGEMTYGAGWVAASRYGASQIIDPRPYALGHLISVYNEYPAVGNVLPAIGYGEEQIRELEATINAADADLVLISTPINLERLIKINKPSLRINYELQEIGQPSLADLLKQHFGYQNLVN